MSVQYSLTSQGGSTAAKGLDRSHFRQEFLLYAILSVPHARSNAALYCLSFFNGSITGCREAFRSHLSPISLQWRWRRSSTVPVEHPEPFTLHLNNCKPLSCGGTQKMKPVKQLQETAIFTYKDYLHPYKRENALHHLSPHKVQ